jgi:light-regulated signal transduction histidine kinase (bacteriophytochrome)
MQTNSQLQVGTRIWILKFSASKNFGSYYLSNFPLLVFCVGVLISVVFSFFLGYYLTDNRLNLIVINERLNRELLERTKAEEKLIEIEQFAFIASHDLQEPLRTDSNYLGMIKDRFANDIPEEGKKFKETVINATQRMKELITGLLDYSNSGKDDNKQEVEVKKIIDEFLLEYEVLIAQKAVKIVVGNLPVVSGFNSGLKSVFMNFINNAVKFQKEGRQPEIKINSVESEKEHVFDGQDNGIEKRYLNNIFVIFHRLNHLSGFPGTGIGLAQCKKNS